MAIPNSSISAETAYWIDIVFILLYLFFLFVWSEPRMLHSLVCGWMILFRHFVYMQVDYFVIIRWTIQVVTLKPCRLFERSKSFLLIIFRAICILAVPSELMVSKIYLLHTDKQHCDLRHHQHVDKCERTLRTCTTLFFSSFLSLSPSFALYNSLSFLLIYQR